MKSKTLIPVLLFVVLFMPQFLHAAISPSIAVAPFENINKDASLDWLSAGIPETVTNSLSSVKGIVLVERMQLRKVMDELKLQYSGIVDEKTAVKLGKLAAANILVIGAFQKSGETVRLTARFLDVESGKILHTAQPTGNLNNIFDLQDKIVLGLIKNLNIEISQDERTKLATAPTTSLDAYRHFGQGVLLESKKDYQGAVKELKQATVIDPKFALAKNKFVEIFLSLNKGNYWIYDLKTTYLGTTVQQIKQISRAGGNEIFMGRQAFSYIDELEIATGNDSAKKMANTHYIKGEDGIYVAGVTWDTIGEMKSRNSFTIFDPPYLLYPYDIDIGKVWTSKWTNKFGSTDFSSAKDLSRMTKTTSVTGRETVSTPAGTFDCYILKDESTTELSATHKTFSSRKPNTTWYAPGVGIVRMLQEIPIGGNNFTVMDYVLSDYKIN